jgi:hypothetical protein
VPDSHCITTAIIVSIESSERLTSCKRNAATTNAVETIMTGWQTDRRLAEVPRPGKRN